MKLQLCTKAIGDYITGTSATELPLENKHFYTLVLPKTAKKSPQMTHS